MLALVWANSPWAASYQALSGPVVGPQALHLDLTLSVWSADGLLAIFFFVAGVELKRARSRCEVAPNRRKRVKKTTCTSFATVLLC